MAKTVELLAGRASGVRPYVERAMTDEKVRDDVRDAITAAREIYDELIGNRGVTTVARRVAGDKDLQENLKTALDELREAAQRIQGKRDHGGRNGALLLAGITLGILFNPVTGPATRKWASDKLFGSSDEFTYGGNSSTSN